MFRKYVGDRAVDQQQGGRGMMRNRIAITAPGAGESQQRHFYAQARSTLVEFTNLREDPEIGSLFDKIFLRRMIHEH